MGTIDRGRKFGLGEPEVVLLGYTIQWMNRYLFEIDGDEALISTHHEPELSELFQDTWTERHKDALVNLRIAGILETRWVAGRPCDWAPTEKYIDVVRHVFDGVEDVYPPWVQHAQPGAPLFGDQNELLTHRKGVLAANHLLQQVVSGTRTTLYPSVDSAHTPDLIWKADTDEVLAYVEVLSEHHDREMCRKKFLAWHDETQVPVIWVYENRDMMIETWNHIERKTAINLDKGEFNGDPSNWSPRRVNSRLRRTRRQSGPYRSIDCVETVGGILGSDPNDGRRFLRRNNIID